MKKKENKQITVCDESKCNGCNACIEVCPKAAIKLQDSLDQLNAIIDPNKCVDCRACYNICPNNKELNCSKPLKWYQGWAEDCEERLYGASGGIAMACARYFIEHGGVVCTCLFKDGKFMFEIEDSLTNLHKFSGSKYVKSKPEGIYKEIKRFLPKRNVLFIGLPCQVAGVKSFVGESLQDNLYTIDLICHGTPSPKVLDCFLKQYSYNLNSLSDIKFRRKHEFLLQSDEIIVSRTGDCDFYMKAFLDGLTYTENCYYCKFAKIERCSDLTIGDSWGSELPGTVQKKGVSLILCQSDKGQQLIENSHIHLESVDIDKARKSNQQLNEPSKIHRFRKVFFRGIKHGIKYNFMYMVINPRYVFRYIAKALAIRLRLRGGVSPYNYNLIVKQKKDKSMLKVE